MLGEHIWVNINRIGEAYKKYKFVYWGHKWSRKCFLRLSKKEFRDGLLLMPMGNWFQILGPAK